MSATKEEGADSFYVTISASGHHPQDPSRIIHAISVTQPVQSWSVVREYEQFAAVGNALTSFLTNLPPCPPPANVLVAPSEGTDGIIRVRNLLQEWLISVLLFPGARQSPAIQDFMTMNANQMPPQFKEVAWLSFENPPTRSNQTNSGGGRAAPQSSGSKSPAAHRSGNASANLDEMQMDDMFDDEGVDSSEEEEDEEEVPPYSQRYPPPDAAVTQEDVDLMDGLEEVEMVTDVGSLAQSLGASHLGRSLLLQEQSGLDRPFATAAGMDPVAGVNHVGLPSNGRADANGGRNSGKDATSRGDNAIPGLGDSFNHRPPVSPPTLDSFQMIKVIGKGSFGKVFLVRENSSGEMFALKVLRKDNIIRRNQVEHTRTERSVLQYVRHPFIVGMNMAFQSRDKLYFVLDYCAGGELFFHLGRLGKFQEPRARFYAAEITLAINYVHQLDIIYRDLKPENVLLDAKGHVRLTDFGLSKEGISNSSSGAYSFCGTPEYLAPEILNRQGHGRAVDWWSMGALLYEMLTGLPPFYCRDRDRLFEKIRKAELTYPNYLSSSTKDILRRLLTRDPTRRLGSGPRDAEDIKGHKFFEEINWVKLKAGEITPPFIPSIKDNLDTSQFDPEFTELPMMSPESQRRTHGFGASPPDNTFEGFTFTDTHFLAPDRVSNRT